jgi:PAS domain S-box-containing protein
MLQKKFSVRAVSAGLMWLELSHLFLWHLYADTNTFPVILFSNMIIVLILMGMLAYIWWNAKHQAKQLILQPVITQALDFRAIFEDNPQAMWIVEADSLKFLEVNQIGLDTYGYSREEFLEISLKELFPKDNPVIFMHLALLSTWKQGECFMTELLNITKDGEEVQFKVMVRCLILNNQRVNLIVNKTDHQQWLANGQRTSYIA